MLGELLTKRDWCIAHVIDCRTTWWGSVSVEVLRELLTKYNGRSMHKKERKTTCWAIIFCRGVKRATYNAHEAQTWRLLGQPVSDHLQHFDLLKKPGLHSRGSLEERHLRVCRTCEGSVQDKAVENLSL